MSLERVHEAIESQFPSHLEAIREFLRTPSISADGTGIAETAEQVRGFIQEVGGKGEVVPTAGHPIVHGELMLGKPKTLLIYGMYDVMPVEGEEWIVPPFGAEIVDFPPHGRCLLNRGVYNTKGPLKGFFNAVSAIRDVAELPVNLKFVIEGEEEQSSRNLPSFIKTNKERLQGDAVYFPFFGLDNRGQPVVHLGAKGMIHLELECQGGEWGGPRTRGIHSSHGAWIASPPWRLVHALSSLVDAEETILVEGFYDDVQGPSPEDEELLPRLAAVFDETKILDETDALRFRFEGLHGEELLKKYMFSPLININGYIAGHTGEGSKTVIGHKATAKMDVRLVPKMTVEGAAQRIKDHLERHGFEDVQARVLGGYPWSRTSVHEPVVQALLETYRHHGYEAEVWPYIGGSAPFFLFHDELGMPFIPGGLCHGGSPHSPNEYAVVDQIELFEKSVATFLHKYAEI
jgi:acetylornithine deacetylase/succinyl-diaminopimelate desuccinylase-like protein